MDTEPGQLDDKGRFVTRPTAMVEVRAWIAFGLITIIHIGSGVWWASALSTDVRYMREEQQQMKLDLRAVRSDAQTAAAAAQDKEMLLNLVADHEARLRVIERTGRRAP